MTHASIGGSWTLTGQSGSVSCVVTYSTLGLPHRLRNSVNESFPFFFLNKEYTWKSGDATSVTEYDSDLTVQVSPLLNKIKVKVLVAQPCQTLWGPMDCGPPGYSLQARILEGVE